MLGRLRNARIALALLAAMVALVTAGCGTATLDRDDVERKAATSLAKVVGQRPDSVTCPHDLPVKVGATMRCKLVGGGVAFGLTVKVVEVEGNTAQLDFQVDQQPLHARN